MSANLYSLIRSGENHGVDTGFAETIAVFSGLIQFKTMRIMFDQGNAKSPFLQAGNQFFQIGCFPVPDFAENETYGIGWSD